MLPTLIRPRALSEAEAEQVTALAERAERVDGVAPLNDDARLALHHGGPAVHLLATRDGVAVGYAQLEHPGEQPNAVLVVDPDHRRAGVGRQLLDAAREAGGAEVGFWSFHGLPAAAALARSAGLVPVRELLVMTSNLTEPVTVPPVPVGVDIRSFRVGKDEQAWLEVNAKAFRHHREQGRMTLEDLRAREAETWFDPAGFLLAVRGDTLVGFHWTKQHPDHLGEVYVLGVDPDSGARGLGRALLAAGLRHLQQRGNTTVQLYVEADQERAVKLYLAHGFTEVSRDVMYASP